MTTTRTTFPHPPLFLLLFVSQATLPPSEPLEYAPDSSVPLRDASLVHQKLPQPFYRDAQSLKRRQQELNRPTATLRGLTGEQKEERQISYGVGCIVLDLEDDMKKCSTLSLSYSCVLGVPVSFTSMSYSCCCQDVSLLDGDACDHL